VRRTVRKRSGSHNLNKTEQVYQPPAWAFRYLGACLDWDIKQTKSERCKAARIGRTTLYLAEQDERFVQWLNDRLTRVIASEHREVRTALLRLCIGGHLEAIKLWHQLYGDFIPTERRIFDGDLSGVPDKTLDEIYRLLETGRPEGKGAKVN